MSQIEPLTTTPRVTHVDDDREVPRETVLTWELTAGRRLIRLLRHALGTQGLLDVLRPYIDESTRRIESLLAESGGAWRRASIRVEADGLSTERFFDWWSRTASTIPELFLTANAEHVAPVPNGAFRPGIVEPLGGLPTAMFFRFNPDQGIEPVDPTYPHNVIGAGRVGSADGPIAARCIHHFRDTDSGMEALLTLEVPAAASDQFVEEARQHLAVEFSRFMMMADANVTELPTLEELI